MSRLYDTDFSGWADETAQLLAQRRFEEIDLDALIEEVEGLAIGDRRAYRSHITTIILHFLKLSLAPLNIYEPNLNGWSGSVRRARRAIVGLLEDSRSAAREKDKAFESAFRAARREALDECADFGPVQWPETCPWTIEQVLDDDFWPERQPSV